MAYTRKYQQGQGNLGRDAELAFFKENTVAIPTGRTTLRNAVGDRTPKLQYEQPNNVIGVANVVKPPDAFDGQ